MSESRPHNTDATESSVECPITLVKAILSQVEESRARKQEHRRWVQDRGRELEVLLKHFHDMVAVGMYQASGGQALDMASWGPHLVDIAARLKGHGFESAVCGQLSRPEPCVRFGYGLLEAAVRGAKVTDFQSILKGKQPPDGFSWGLFISELGDRISKLQTQAEREVFPYLAST